MGAFRGLGADSPVFRPFPGGLKTRPSYSEFWTRCCVDRWGALGQIWGGGLICFFSGFSLELG
jgi:hypothetical protein